MEYTKCNMVNLNVKNFKTQSLDELFRLLDNQVYFVGGTVRDALLGNVICDIDMATPFSPSQVILRLKESSIRVIPTGIEHGTLTLILTDGVTIELTSFRSDVKTDGRHAQVSFGSKIQEDALRRDFTINALYMDNNGDVFDFVGGLKDVRKKRLRFIGDAKKRISEDALRILRFFRFCAKMSIKMPDKSALKACKQTRSLLDVLSKERVREEFLKILSVENPYPTLKLMDSCSVLRQIFGKYDLAEIRRLCQHERRSGFYTNPLFRLWVLCGKKLPDWKFSRLQKQQEKLFKKAFDFPLKNRSDEYRILYYCGKDVFLYTVLYKKRLCFMAMRFYQALKKPELPFNSQDVSSFFDVKNIKLGEKMTLCEEKWLELECPDKKELVFKCF